MLSLALVGVKIYCYGRHGVKRQQNAGKTCMNFCAMAADFFDLLAILAYICPDLDGMFWREIL